MQCVCILTMGVLANFSSLTYAQEVPDLQVDPSQVRIENESSRTVVLEEYDAENGVRPNTLQRLADRIDLQTGLSVGLMRGESSELVYGRTSGQRISELTWDFTPSPYIGVQLEAKANKYINLQADAWTLLFGQNGQMDNRDWLFTPPPSANVLISSDAGWSHQSSHKDAPIERAFGWDVNAQALLLPHNEDKSGASLQFEAMIGFRHDARGMSAFGGDYTYSSGLGWRDLSGNFDPDEEVISCLLYTSDAADD